MNYQQNKQHPKIGKKYLQKIYMIRGKYPNIQGIHTTQKQSSIIQFFKKMGKAHK